MKRILIAVMGLTLIVMVSVSAFLLGRLTSPAARMPIPENSTVSNAIKNFQQAQADALTLIEAQPQFQSSEQSRAEGYQSFLYNMVKAVEVSALHNPYDPVFTSIAGPSAKSGMDNPDNEYLMAVIHEHSDYRITGQMRSDRLFYIQSMVGEPGVGSAGPGTITDTMGPNKIIFNDDGRFEIYVSKNRPDNADNWLRLESGAGTVLIRFGDMTWPEETPQDFIRIERVCDTCPESRPKVDDAAVAGMFNRAAASLHDRTASWSAISARIWSLVPRNTVSRFRETRNGLKGQFSAFGTFDIAEDEALIVAVPDTQDAAYQGIQLASRWFLSLDYQTRQTSLTRDQSRPDPDGFIRYIISHNDPGVWNWLDTAGHNEGLMMIRWQGVEEKPTPAPSSELVKLGDLVAKLPERTVRITAQERKAAIKSRHTSSTLRFQ